MRLKGRKALVTGGSRSIGRAIAIGLAREGADVVVNYKSSKEAADDTVQMIENEGRRSTAIQASTDTRTDVDRLVEEADDFLEGIDLLVPKRSGTGH
jgi:NAD(P)-dependent dehydrogenase (short-subunit alcohol dehydrogenase family)